MAEYHQLLLYVLPLSLFFVPRCVSGPGLCEGQELGKRRNKQAKKCFSLRSCCTVKQESERS